MSQEQTFSAAELEQYRLQLRSMRDRLNGDIDKLVDSVRAELDPASNLSSVPVHMGDIAPEQIDADIDVIETERGMMGEIQAALKRIDDGSFGVCVDCGQPIARERIDLIPYTPYCVNCAKKHS